MFTNHIYLIYIYKKDLALNNLQGLMCHKTPTKPSFSSPVLSLCVSLISSQSCVCLPLFLSLLLLPNLSWSMCISLFAGFCVFVWIFVPWSATVSFSLSVSFSIYVSLLPLPVLCIWIISPWPASLSLSLSLSLLKYFFISNQPLSIFLLFFIYLTIYLIYFELAITIAITNY